MRERCQVCGVVLTARQQQRGYCDSDMCNPDRGDSGQEEEVRARLIELEAQER